MAHTYYRYNKHDGQFHRSVELESIGHDDLVKLRVFDNMNRPGHACISLNREEQEDLIKGILERRGLLIDFGVTGRITQRNGAFSMQPINGDSEKQSAVHPAEPVTEKERQEEKPFTSASCEGEVCTVCWQAAAHKLEETIFHDDPHPQRHPLTAYVCDYHFNMIVRPYVKNELDTEGVETLARAEWERLHKGNLNIGNCTQSNWEYWLSAFQKLALLKGVSAYKVELLKNKIRAIINTTQFVENSPANDYNHGKHTAANMILDDLNEIFYGSSGDTKE